MILSGIIEICNSVIIPENIKFPFDFYGCPNKQNWMCKLCMFSQIRSHLVLSGQSQAFTVYTASDKCPVSEKGLATGDYIFCTQVLCILSVFVWKQVGILLIPEFRHLCTGNNHTQMEYVLYYKDDTHHCVVAL